MSTHITLGDPEGTMLREIEDAAMKREDVALSYAMGLRAPDEVDWSKVNHAIIDRWSLSALKWIKERAWKLAKGVAQ